MSAEHDDFKIPKLNPDNYHTWIVRARVVMLIRNCWNAVDVGYGTMMSDPEKKKNNNALSFILLLVKAFGEYFPDHTFAQVFLMELPQIYEPLISHLEQEESKLDQEEVKARQLIEDKERVDQGTKGEKNR